MRTIAADWVAFSREERELAYQSEDQASAVGNGPSSEAHARTARSCSLTPRRFASVDGATRHAARLPNGYGRGYPRSLISPIASQRSCRSRDSSLRCL